RETRAATPPGTPECSPAPPGCANTLLHAPHSSMTNAAFDHLLGMHIALRSQFASALRLVCGRLPRHVENFVALANELLRLPMAIQAPLHVESVRLPNQRHLVHRTVAA